MAEFALHKLYLRTFICCWMVNGFAFLPSIFLLTTYRALQHLSQTPIHTDIHSLMAEAAMQRADRLLRN